MRTNAKNSHRIRNVNQSSKFGSDKFWCNHFGLMDFGHPNHLNTPHRFKPPLSTIQTGSPMCLMILLQMNSILCLYACLCVWSNQVIKFQNCASNIDSLVLVLLLVKWKFKKKTSYFILYAIWYRLNGTIFFGAGVSFYAHVQQKQLTITEFSVKLKRFQVARNHLVNLKTITSNQTAHSRLICDVLTGKWFEIIILNQL